MIQFLIDHNADYNSGEDFGETPLHIAALSGKYTSRQPRVCQLHKYTLKSKIGTEFIEIEFSNLINRI